MIHKEGKYRGHPVKKTRSHLFFKGNKELYDKIDRTDNFIITNGISYVGKRRYQDNVAKMYAMAIEIDGIKGLDGVRQLIHTWHRPVTEMDGKKYYNMTPKPTYITCSGRGLHLYFVFEEPIVLYKNIFEELSRVRKRWIDLFWNSRVTKMSDKNSIQYETLTQGFRAVGSKTRLDDTYVLAFKVGEKHTLESLNEILSEDDKIKIGYKSKMSLEEAKKRYPDWYQRRIVEGQKKPSEDFVFHRHRGIYDNWKQKIISGAVVGKRYYCLENLCSLAVQCCISPEELEKDHIIIERNGYKLEIQIRTRLQHYWAESIERASVIYREHLKEMEGDPAVLKYFKLTSDLFHKIERGYKPSLEERNKIDTLHIQAKKIMTKNHFDQVLNAKVEDGFIRAMIARESNLRYKLNNWMLIFNWKKGKFENWILVSRDCNKATEQYADYEKQFTSENGYEVVMIGSSDVSVIQHTHSHYFGIDNYDKILETVDESLSSFHRQNYLEPGERMILLELYKRGYWGKKKVMSIDTLRNHYCKEIPELKQSLAHLAKEGYVIYHTQKGTISLNLKKKAEIELFMT